MVSVYLILLLFAATICSSLLDLTSQDQHSTNHHLLTQLHEAKLKVAQFESSLEEIVQKAEAKELYLKKQEKQIQDSEKTLSDLHFTLSNLKSGSLLTDEKVHALEEEVRVLWATSRKNNFDIHVLQSKAQDAEDRLQVVHSQVEKMADIVSEQWIQIQQFEHALQLRQMTMLKAQRRVGPPRCSFLKVIFMNDLSSKYLPSSLRPLGLNSFGNWRSYIFQTLNQLRRFFSTMKESHHELQGLIRQEMERHELTARLANKELVFFVASALIIFPVFSAWILLSSQLQ
ncbi:uncharacterized protein LOC8258427 isoform X1 [Ricinus communis]|uniref:uncharacterized protein LOC8258427 isoform X1 n=1 Tax=Ricinus communis TaxID=3988 RepID=UPI0007727FB3|nr:uncharacterized protein LOC8258427 isoform X1 [Ricinus communis]|eukprot:XP_015571871.1 uncharacterized protein LOC8258427 isoform X1 [Ricinus communis]